MQAARGHRVPLSIARSRSSPELAEARTSEFVFPGQLGGQPLSNWPELQLRRMGLRGATTHGFRSSFRDWAGETTAFPREVIEHALAHRMIDKAEAAYAQRHFARKAPAADGGMGCLLRAAPA